MRSYPQNSPEAMARLLTTLMADDRIEDSQVEALQALDAYAQIEIAPSRFAEVLRDYFADLKEVARSEQHAMVGSALVDSSMQAAIIDEIDDPKVRLRLWEIMIGLARADGDIAMSEATLLRRIAQRWWRGQPPDALQAASSPT